MKRFPFVKNGRRAFVKIAVTGGGIAAISLLVGCMSDVDTPEASGDVGEFATAFADPPNAVRAKFRWWWPHGLVDEAEIRREVRSMADAGFGGAEIADVHHSVSEPLDPAGHGWGTEPWIEAVVAALEEAREQDLIMDLTLGPSWPVALPTVDPNSPEAMTELATGTALVEAGETFDGAIPPPDVEAHQSGTRETLLLVQAARLAEGADPAADVVELVPESVREVAVEANATELNWTAPGEGRWLLISYWQRGSGQRPERGPHSEPVSYVVDHFSEAGAQAVIDYWEANILDDHMRSLLRDAGGAFFEDSIEMETDVTLWTPGLLEIFKERKGYSLLPYLPLIVQKDEDPIFRFPGDIAAHVEHDWWNLMGTLFIEEHLAPLQEWAHGLGMKLRGQPYGMATDAIGAAAFLDIAEGESLGFENLDDFRALAGGRDMGGHTILSNEAGAFAGGAYSTTWERMLRTLNPIFAAGVNQTVLHGYSYAEVPDVKWPGFAAFTPYNGFPGYAGSWGPRQPTWAHVSGIADYFARIQLVLQTGEPQVDVAFLRQKGYAGSGFGAPWLSATGNALGWTHVFVSPATLELPTATVRDGRMAPDGPAFRVLVFEGDAFHERESTMPVDTARKLLELARDGLPMVVVGDWSNPRTPGLAQGDEEARLKTIFEELLALPNVENVATRDQIGNGLDALDIERAVEHTSVPFVHAIRRDGENRFFFFANSGEADASATIWLERTVSEHIPYRLDPWSGEVAPIALYSESDDKIALDLRLAAGTTAMLALAPRDWASSSGVPAVHALSSDAPHVRFGPDGLVIRAFSEGRFRTELADGNTVETEVEAVPAAPKPGPWTLEVEDWRPGASATETEKVVHELTLERLIPWTEIPELNDASGIGRYRTTIHLGEDWDAGVGALLTLGEVFDTALVRVNGQTLSPVDPLNPVVDLGRHLRPGENTLEIEVATTLNNRLRVSHAEVYSVNKRQPYGLMGPVVLRPYREREL